MRPTHCVGSPLVPWQHPRRPSGAFALFRGGFPTLKSGANHRCAYGAFDAACPLFENRTSGFAVSHSSTMRLGIHGARRVPGSHDRACMGSHSSTMKLWMNGARRGLDIYDRAGCLRMD